MVAKEEMKALIGGSSREREACVLLKGAPQEVPGEFNRCFWLLERREGGLRAPFGDLEEFCFLEELESSLAVVGEHYQQALEVPGRLSLCLAWRLSRRARARLLELLAKHEERSASSLAKVWSAGELAKLPFFTGAGLGERLQALAAALGSGQPAGGGVVREDFVRTTYKYVMPPEDVADFLCDVMPHLPLYVFKRGGAVFAPTHSIYLDGEGLPLYHRKAGKEPEGATLLRLRWYEQDEPGELFAETKTSKNRFTGMPAQKSRARVERSALPELLQGRKAGPPALQGFQEKLVKARARPVLRTSARRVCFQVPEDSSLRITVDLDFEAVLEGEGAWQFRERRCPYVHCRDAVSYPLAIVEVKVEGGTAEQPPVMPQWLSALVQSRSFAELDISKYVFAAATLLPGEVSFVPEWYRGSLVASEKAGPSKPMVRIDPRTVLKTENLTLKWFGLSAIPLGSVLVSSRRISRALHSVSLIFTVLMIMYATRLYWQRVDLLTKGEALLPDRQGIVLAAVCLCTYGVLFTLMIDFED